MTRPDLDPSTGALTESAPPGATPRLLDAPLLVAASLAWVCPRCGHAQWTFDGAPRCRRCGFWETAS